MQNGVNDRGSFTVRRYSQSEHHLGIGKQLLLELSSKTLERRAPLHQPVVKFLRVMYVIPVRYDGVDQLLSTLYTLLAFIRQESSLGWTVDA